MIALDTNVLVRYILQDQASEQKTAERLIAENDCSVSWSVLVEVCWVLESHARLEREAVANGLAAIGETERISVPDEASFGWAVERYANGADFADMVHLASALNGATEFASFDRNLAKQAGSDAPLAVQTLRA